jgi:hypothetical protein
LPLRTCAACRRSCRPAAGSTGSPPTC